MTEIVSADKGDTIKLIYSNQYNISTETHVTTSLKDDISDPATANPHFITNSVDLSHSNISVIRLNEIDFRNGKVTFEYNTSQRSDQLNDSSLVGLRVYQSTKAGYTEIKRYSLYQSYFNCKNIAPQNVNGVYYTTVAQRLRLDSLKQVDVTGNTMPGYNFGYVNKQLPYLDSYAQDFWGFYNAVGNTCLLIYNSPNLGINANPPSTTYGANRNVNPDSVDAGMLNKITFPTGGYTTFQFESNTLGSTTVGGVRIKKIVSYDGLGGGIVKTYNYLNPNPISNLYNGNMSTFGLFFSEPYTSAEPFSSMNPSMVTRSYTSYLENFTVPLGSSSGAAVSYGQVEELFDSTNGVNGKNVYYFDVSQDASPSIIPQNVVTNEWIRGTKLAEKKYKTTTPGSFTLLESKQYVYNLYARNNYNIFSFASKVTHLDQYSGTALMSTYPACPQWSTYNTFMNVYNPITIGNNYLTQEIDTLYDQNGLNPQIKWVNYYYEDTLNTQPTRTQTTNSKGDTLKTYSWTPLEKPSINSALALTPAASLAIDSLVAKNIISPVIQQDQYYGTTLRGRTRTNYKVFTANLVAPTDLQVQIGSNPIETRIQYNNYDAYGNIISGGKTNDALTTYIWDYQKSFVIAAVTNADSSSVAYTSFESDGTGNWSFTDTTRYRTSSMTGSQSYLLVTGKSITKSVPSGKSYIVSYWSRNGAITVSANGSSIAVSLTGLTKNGWTYYEHALPNTTTSVSITATSAIIDELRLYPQTAQMTTCTYNPLVGVSSICSINNSVVYYEYDLFNRLKTIRDIDKNAIKVIDYEYQASPHTFYSTVQSGAFARNNCTSCLMGSTVTYTVPANTYTSVVSQPDADQKALNDLNNNGPAYANANGSCNTPTTAPITGANGTTKSFTLTFHNTCTGTNYNFTLNVTTGTPISPVPVGTYNISISPVGGSGTYTYIVDGFVQNTTNANFSGITLSTTSNTITIH